MIAFVGVIIKKIMENLHAAFLLIIIIIIKFY